MSECLKEVQANDKRPIKRLSPKVESPIHGECLIACVLKRNGVIQNGKINKGKIRLVDSGPKTIDFLLSNLCHKRVNWWWLSKNRYITFINYFKIFIIDTYKNQIVQINLFIFQKMYYYLWENSSLRILSSWRNWKKIWIVVLKSAFTIRTSVSWHHNWMIVLTISWQAISTKLWLITE